MRIPNNSKASVSKIAKAFSETTVQLMHKALHEITSLLVLFAVKEKTKKIKVFLLMALFFSRSLSFVLPIPLPVPLLKGLLDINLELGDQTIFSPVSYGHIYTCTFLRISETKSLTKKE